MKTKHLFILFLTFFTSFNFLFAQYEQVEEESVFSSRISNPIKIEPLKQDNEYVFYAYNRSFYPYRVTISFTELLNLTPMVYKQSFTVEPGNHRLFSLTISNEEASHSYRYEYTYVIGVSSKDVDKKYPYLIPVGPNASFDFVIPSEGIILKDYFRLSPGDTVFCMRKGLVAATPDMYHDEDRISGRKSLEIIHCDGTVMVYENVDPEKVFIKAGTTVYPGQSLGQLRENSDVEVFLYMFKKDNLIERLEINYVLSETKTAVFSESIKNYKVVYPTEIITREMTKRELKKYRKNEI